MQISAIKFGNVNRNNNIKEQRTISHPIRNNGVDSVTLSFKGEPDFTSALRTSLQTIDKRKREYEDTESILHHANTKEKAELAQALVHVTDKHGDYHFRIEEINIVLDNVKSEEQASLLQELGTAKFTSGENVLNGFNLKCLSKNGEISQKHIEMVRYFIDLYAAQGRTGFPDIPEINYYWTIEDFKTDEQLEFFKALAPVKDGNGALFYNDYELRDIAKQITTPEQADAKRELANGLFEITNAAGNRKFTAKDIIKIVKEVDKQEQVQAVLKYAIAKNKNNTTSECIARYARTILPTFTTSSED